MLTKPSFIPVKYNYRNNTNEKSRRIITYGISF